MILFGYDPASHGMVRQRVGVDDADRVAAQWRAIGLDVGAYQEPDDPPTVDELLAGLVAEVRPVDVPVEGRTGGVGGP